MIVSAMPIEPVLPEVRRILREHGMGVLVAPPGAGKTTCVPLALLQEPWLAGKKLLMLEPRRLAARSAARYMAAQRKEPVGETIGYRVRNDTRTGPKTRIEVVTEGVLTRMLQEDPSLDGIGAVLFDEFHERHLQADLGLALCLQTRELFREDLRLLVMSATLEPEPVAQLMGGAPVLVSEGRSYPVETVYADRSTGHEFGALESAMTRTILSALDRHSGDVLAFLPGVAEIRRTGERLSGALADGRRSGIQLAPLYGDLSAEEQDEAIAPPPPGLRKVVLATSIAETSLTVEGIRIVVDSGLMRVSRFSPRTGMTRLDTVAVTRPAADQRRGRAGRVAEGVCYRLWTAEEDARLASRSTPELLEADLAPLALELAAWGVQDAAELAWLDVPPAAGLAQARELLQQLGALDSRGALTPDGRRMAALGLHPRLARLLLAAQRLGLGRVGCALAALLGERDPFRGGREAGSPEADLRPRVAAVLRARSGQGPLGRIAAEAERLARALGLPAGSASAAAPAGSEEASGLLLAFAYPDRIAERQEGGRYCLSGGRGAVLAGPQVLSAARYLVAADLDGQGSDGRIRLAAPLTEAEIAEHAADLIREEAAIYWDPDAEAVRARKRRLLGALVLRETPLADPDPEQVTAALLAGIRRLGLTALPWTKGARQWLARVQFVRWHNASWPDVSEEGLLATLEEWLAPHLNGMKSRTDLSRLSLQSALESLLPWDKRRALEELAPTHLSVPSGSWIPVDYSNPEAPALAVRLQELFGLTDTPRVCGGRVPVVLHLLSPAQRPVQVTRDLASFWANGYFEVKKDLKGRYPKHYWPEDPMEAVPTNRVRPRPS
ncbi:ATP-dependent helicase HrpB [Gorillibacterium sp. CAU 1737]|uniref:ATP-dependent helicase HrpB n=1 Tax=Gorillibacterium sp. CAU 1737 TaxID=3140362 RepID=UPI0032602FF0